MLFRILVFILFAALAPTTALAQNGTSTVSYKVSETREGLSAATELPYKSSPISLPYTFKDQSQGVKFIWVEFKDSTGKTDIQNAQIRYTSVGSSKPFVCENYGDLNLDGRITKDDANMALQIFQGKINPNTSGKEYMRVVGDVNDDEKVDTTDAQIIQQYLEGKTSTFPVCAKLKLSPCNNLGDVTGDGKISKIDAQEALNIVVGNPNSIYTSKPYTDEQKRRADVDLQSSNGEKVTSRDALVILKYLLGEITTFEGCVQSSPTPTPTSGLISSKLTTLNPVWTASLKNDPVGSVNSEYSSNAPFNIFMYLSYDFANCPVSMTRGANYIYTGVKSQYNGDTEFFLFGNVDKATQCKITLKGRDIFSNRSVPDASIMVTIKPAI